MSPIYAGSVGVCVGMWFQREDQMTVGWQIPSQICVLHGAIEFCRFMRSYYEVPSFFKDDLDEE